MAGLTLEIVEGSGSGRHLELSGPLEVGRDPHVPVVLEDDQVSRHHARIGPSNEHAVVEDLGSTNGTYVNEQPIHAPRAIVPGDRIRCGLTVLELRSARQVAAQPSAILPSPEITRIGGDVLRPVPEHELPGGAPATGARGAVLPPGGAPAAAAPPPRGPAPPAAAPPTPAPPPVKVSERTPGFVPPDAVGDVEAESDFNALAALVDTRVKHQTTIAVFAILAIAALALLVFFGAR